MAKKFPFNSNDFNDGSDFGITDRYFLAHKAAEKSAREDKKSKILGMIVGLATIVAAVATVVSLFI